MISVMRSLDLKTMVMTKAYKSSTVGIRDKALVMFLVRADGQAVQCLERVLNPLTYCVSHYIKTLPLPRESIW